MVDPSPKFQLKLVASVEVLVKLTLAWVVTVVDGVVNPATGLAVPPTTTLLVTT